MTKVELNSFREVLTARYAGLGNLGRDRNLLKAEATPEDLDRIQQANDHDLTVSGIQRNSILSRAVRDALDRVAAGTFGICVGCEEEISPKRLSAVPWAAYCIGCQEAVDRGEEMSRTELAGRDRMAA